MGEDDVLRLVALLMAAALILPAAMHAHRSRILRDGAIWLAVGIALLLLYWGFDGRIPPFF